MTFGEKIREARITLKLTQKQLADKIGAKHNSISDWENDKNKPDPNTIELLCGVLNISPNYLLGTSSDEFSLYEKEIVKKYRALDDHGREMVDFTLQKEWERSTTDTVIKSMNERYNAYSNYAVAARNNNENKPGEMKKMQRDADRLIRPEQKS